MTPSVFDGLGLHYDMTLPPGVTVEECDTFCFGEEHDSPEGSALKEKYIQRWASPGDIVLVEGIESLSEVTSDNLFFPFTNKDIAVSSGLEIYGWDIKDVCMVAAEREVLLVAIKIHNMHRYLLNAFTPIDDVLNWESLFFDTLEVAASQGRTFDVNGFIKYFYNYAEKLTKFDQARGISEKASEFAVNFEQFHATEPPLNTQHRKKLEILHKELDEDLEARADFLASFQVPIAARTFQFRTISMVNTLQELDRLSSTAHKCFIVAGAAHFKEGLIRCSPEEQPLFSLKFFREYIDSSPRKIAVLIPKKLT